MYKEYKYNYIYIIEMSRLDYLPENPNYPQDFKFPDTVNNNLKIKYHYVDGTFKATTNQSSFPLEMMNPTSTLLKNYKNVKSVELIHAVFASSNISEPIVYMFIKEFENVIDSTMPAGQGAFTKLFFNLNTVDAGANASIIALISDNMNPILEFETKGKRIDKMTISFKLYNTTTGPLVFAQNDIISLTFKIGVIEPINPR
jgi:hypothetical protein